MNNNLKIKNRKAIFWLVILVAFLIMLLISIIINKDIIINKIIETAKKEAKKTLLSSGIVVEKNNEGVTGQSEMHLSENTILNPQPVGTKVVAKENWNIETVTAISIGNGETIPVPKGFYYVGGDLNTGVIISDEETDKYDGQTDKTTWEYSTNLKGNQFVWIPGTVEEYVKSEIWNGITQRPSGTTSGTGILSSGGAWDKTTYSSELPQIRKYGGFYVARYEAGLAKTITEFTSTQKNTGANQVYNVEGIPQSKAGIIPWMFIDWIHSHINAKSMYNTSSVSSGLITGTQWDVMLKQIVKRTELTEEDLINSEKWGNYRDTNITYIGRKLTSTGYSLLSFGGQTNSTKTIYSSDGDGDLLTTGASNQTETYHIFDIAGNLWEHTEEISLWHKDANQDNIQRHTMRGGSFLHNYGMYPACYRLVDTGDSYTYSYTGFRVVLYIK